MKRMMIAVAVGLLSMTAGQAASKPLKVFILAGQSNMEGPAHVRTIEGIGDDPATAPLYKEMTGPDGKPVVCPNAWLSYLTGEGDNNTIETVGRMTAGYGSMWGKDHSKPGDMMGPEFTFAIYMGKAVKEPFLIIKTAWGGKSLHTDFRPPSAGPQPLHDSIKARIKERGGDIVKSQQEEDKRLGVYYRYMIEHVRKVFGDIKRVVPGYDPSQGYELAGFVWLQAWNDWCDSWWYPPEWGEKRFDEALRVGKCLTFWAVSEDGLWMLIANDQADPEMQKFEGGWIRRDLLVPGVTGGVSLPVWTLTPTPTPSETPTITPTWTPSLTPTLTPSETPTPTETGTPVP